MFDKHGTRGTWYAHASVGTLHVRPILDMKPRRRPPGCAPSPKRPAELVREYKGVYSGEHGDGLVRSEWIEPILGAKLTAALGEVKALFDPRNLMNPGKIVRPTKMDDRSLLRVSPGYQPVALKTTLDWSAWDVHGAAKVCSPPRRCATTMATARKFDAGTMCPSFRATGDEQHLTRGRANTLRLALSGRLGDDALTAPAMREALELCVGCKGCKRECPTGVDMARMKIEVAHQQAKRHGLSSRRS